MDTTLTQEQVTRLAEVQGIAAQLVALALVKYGTLRAAAGEVGCSASTLLRLMRGDTSPSLLLLSKLAAVVGRRIVSTSAGGWVLS